jgi:hypothetical protein
MQSLTYLVMIILARFCTNVNLSASYCLSFTLVYAILNKINHICVRSKKISPGQPLPFVIAINNIVKQKIMIRSNKGCRITIIAGINQ